MKLLTIVFIFFLASCGKEEDIVTDTDGVVTKLPHQWATSISNNGKLAEVICTAHIIYKDQNVLIGGNTDNRRQLIGLDTRSGKIDWKWGDLLTQLTNPAYVDPILVDEARYYRTGNRLCFVSGGNTYLVDLQEGKSIAKNQVTLQRRDICSGIGEILFTSGSIRNSQESEGLYVNNIMTLIDPSLVAHPKYDLKEEDPTSPAKGLIWVTLPYEKAGEVFLTVLFGDPVNKSRQSSTAMGLYNFSQRKWVYDRMLLNGSFPNSNVTYAKIYNEKVYHTSTRSMSCHDLLTGREIWTANFSQGFVFSGFTIQEGKIFANNGDRYTYCLNPETGRQIWKEESSGSASPISYLNGVLYFMGGGDGRLHAIDANTGKHLWRLRSPDVDKNSDAFFYGTCVAVPGQGGKKGRVVATTGLNAYGYEAIR